MTIRQLKVLLGHAKLMKLVFTLDQNYEFAKEWLRLERLYERQLQKLNQCR